jgi:hypothetical protein
MPPATPWCPSVSMPRPVARVRSARHAPRLNMRRANLPSGRKPITRRSKPHGNGRRRPRSRPTMPGGRALRARTHRPSGGVVYDNVATPAKPKHTYSTSLLPRRSTWWASRRGWRTHFGPRHDDLPLQHSRHRRLRRCAREFAISIPAFVETTGKCLCHKGSCLSAQHVSDHPGQPKTSAMTCLTPPSACDSGSPARPASPPPPTSRGAA